MKSSVSSLLIGFLFAIGLGISGMTQSQKVIGFLDVFGTWDPSLLFVMVGAIAVHFVMYKIIRKRNSPLFSTEWQVPEKKEITKSLLIGSALFGVGWGMGGYCPGPAVVSLASFQLTPFIFVLGMIGGMVIFRLVESRMKN